MIVRSAFQLIVVNRRLTEQKFEERVGPSHGWCDRQVKTLRGREVGDDTATATGACGASSSSTSGRSGPAALHGRRRIRRAYRRRRVKLIDGVTTAAAQDAPE